MFLTSKRTKCFTMFDEMSPSSLFKFLFLTFPISRTTFVQNVLQMELVQHHSYFGVYTLSLVFPSLWCNNVHVTFWSSIVWRTKRKQIFVPFLTTHFTLTGVRKALWRGNWDKVGIKEISCNWIIHTMLRVVRGHTEHSIPGFSFVCNAG